MNTCIQCGEGLPEGASACPRCGSPVLTISPPLALDALRHPLESTVFALLAVAGAISWLVLLIVTMGAIIPFGLVIWFFNWVGIKIFRAHLLTHCVRVDENHFPHVHRAIEEARQKLGYREPLEVYIMEGTMLNAFVAAVLRTRCMVLFSQLVEGIEEDEAALRGLAGHELAHFVLGHFRWRWLVMAGIWVPLLYLAWSRLCEYSADRCGQACAGDLHAYERVLITLAAGWRLARHVKPELLIAQANEAQNSVFARLIEITSTHPCEAHSGDTAVCTGYTPDYCRTQRSNHAGRGDAFTFRGATGRGSRGVYRCGACGDFCLAGSNIVSRVCPGT